MQRYIVKSTHKGVNQHSKYVTQGQQKPESPTLTLTWNTCKYNVCKLPQRYVLNLEDVPCTVLNYEDVTYFECWLTPLGFDSAPCSGPRSVSGLLYCKTWILWWGKIILIVFQQRGSRVVRQKGKAALGLLDPLESLGRRHCCVDQCVRVGCSLNEWMNENFRIVHGKPPHKTFHFHSASYTVHTCKLSQAKN